MSGPNLESRPGRLKMVNEIECLIWGRGFKATGGGLNRNLEHVIFNSPRAGGRYMIKLDATIELEDGNVDDSVKARLTTMLIDQREQQSVDWPKVTLDLIERAKRKPPLPAHERADRLLKFLDKSIDSVAENFIIRLETHKAYAWSESLKWMEICYFLNYLDEMGWIQAEQSHFSYDVMITVSGYRRIDEQKKNVDSSQALASNSIHRSTQNGSTEEYDFFICHASEDKDTFVGELANELRRKGAEVWYDEFAMRVGRRLRRSIDRGLKHSRFGIVVLSKHFFAKDWTQQELDGMVSLHSSDSERILPIWHKVTREEVVQFSPVLADVFALKTSERSIEEIAYELINVLNEPIK